MVDLFAADPASRCCSEPAAEKDPEHLRRGDGIPDAYRQKIEHPRILGGIWFHMREETG